MEKENIITAKNLSAGYSSGKSQKIVFENANFSIAKGEFVGILGPNGAGKTTLLKIIINELSADEGEIEKPDHFGYVPQIIKDYQIVRDNCTIEEFMFEEKGLGGVVVANIGHEADGVVHPVVGGVVAFRIFVDRGDHVVVHDPGGEQIAGLTFEEAIEAVEAARGWP